MEALLVIVVFLAWRAFLTWQVHGSSLRLAAKLSCEHEVSLLAASSRVSCPPNRLIALNAFAWIVVQIAVFDVAQDEQDNEVAARFAFEPGVHRAYLDDVSFRLYLKPIVWLGARHEALILDLLRKSISALEQEGLLQAQHRRTVELANEGKGGA